MPERIQLRRTKGWRKPVRAVVVSRPSQWGNPFRVVHRECPIGGMCWAVLSETTFVTRHLDSERAARAEAVRLFRRSVEQDPWRPGEIRAVLAGRDLACWCPLDQPCNADVLLAIANGADQ